MKSKKMPKYNAGGHIDPEKIKAMLKKMAGAATGVSAVKGAVSAANELNGGNVFQRAGYDLTAGGSAGATMGKMTKTAVKKAGSEAAASGMKEIFEEAASSGAYNKSKQSLKAKKEKGIHIQGKKIPRITSKPSKGGSEVKFESYRFGGKVYKDGGRALFEALKKKFGEG